MDMIDVCIILIIILSIEAFISMAMIIALKKAVENIKINIIDLNSAKEKNKNTLAYLDKFDQISKKNIDILYERLIQLSEYTAENTDSINTVIDYLERKYNEENGIIEADKTDNKEE